MSTEARDALASLGGLCIRCSAVYLGEGQGALASQSVLARLAPRHAAPVGGGCRCCFGLLDDSRLAALAAAALADISKTGAQMDSLKAKFVVSVPPLVDAMRVIVRALLVQALPRAHNHSSSFAFPTFDDIVARLLQQHCGGYRRRGERWRWRPTWLR